MLSGNISPSVRMLKASVRALNCIRAKTNAASAEIATTPPVVAKITIRPQDFNTEARKRQCEDLFFTPWHGVAEHQPIGGINRLKLGVYRASSAFRHFPKEPAGFDK